MAPSVPEEIDVFTRPHSRMKELVNNFTQKMVQADLSNISTLLSLLADLHVTLLEFRRHEAIENVLILDRLKLRIRQQHKQPPAHLGQCHDDDNLPKLFEFVRWCEGVLSGGSCTTGRKLQSKQMAGAGVGGSSCAEVGGQLHSAYTHFLQHFLPHMKHEEQEFQPLLMNHFEYNELKALKDEVWRQHELYSKQQPQLHNTRPTVDVMPPPSPNIITGPTVISTHDYTQCQTPPAIEDHYAADTKCSDKGGDEGTTTIILTGNHLPQTSSSSSLYTINLNETAELVTPPFIIKTPLNESSVATSLNDDGTDCNASHSNNSSQCFDLAPDVNDGKISTSTYVSPSADELVNSTIAFHDLVASSSLNSISSAKLDVNKSVAKERNDVENFQPINWHKYLNEDTDELDSFADVSQIQTNRAISHSRSFTLSNEHAGMLKVSKEDFNNQHLQVDNNEPCNKIATCNLSEDNCSSNNIKKQYNMYHSLDFFNNKHHGNFDREYDMNINSSSNRSSVSNYSVTSSGTESVKLDTCLLDTNITLTVTTSTTSLLIMPHEVLLTILRYLSPQDLTRLAAVSHALNVVAYDKSLWRKIYPTQWAKGLWSWHNLELGNALEDDSYSKIEQQQHHEALDEDADADTSQPATSAGRHQVVMEGLVTGVCSRVGVYITTIVLDGAVAVCSRSLNKMLALCSNVSTLSAAYCSIDYIAFKGLWQHGALQKLQFLDLQGCDKIDDSALNCLALCAVQKCSTNHCNHQCDGLSNDGTASSTSKYMSSSQDKNSSNNPEDKIFGCEESDTTNYKADELCKTENACEYEDYKRWLDAGSNDSLEEDHAVDTCDDCTCSQSNLHNATRWDYHPTTIDTVSRTSYLSSVIHTNFSLNKTGNIHGASGLNGQANSHCVTHSRNNECEKRSNKLCGTRSASSDCKNTGSKLASLNLSGCRSVSSKGLELLVESGMLSVLRTVDLSGCDLLTNSCLSKLLASCPLLSFDKLTYCDNVQDVPGEHCSGGCDNLAHPLRYCCRRGD